MDLLEPAVMDASEPATMDSSEPAVRSQLTPMLSATNQESSPPTEFGGRGTHTWPSAKQELCLTHPKLAVCQPGLGYVPSALGHRPSWL